MNCPSIDQCIGHLKRMKHAGCTEWHVLIGIAVAFFLFVFVAAILLQLQSHLSTEYDHWGDRQGKASFFQDHLCSDEFSVFDFEEEDAKWLSNKCEEKKSILRKSPTTHAWESTPKMIGTYIQVSTFKILGILLLLFLAFVIILLVKAYYVKSTAFTLPTDFLYGAALKKRE